MSPRTQSALPCRFSHAGSRCALAFAIALGAPNLAFAAEPEPQTVIVEGERPQPQAAPRSAHVSSSVVRRERLEQPGMTAADALRDVPSVQVVQLGGFGAPATLTLRGATSAQTPVYLGGVRINDDVGGSADLAEIPLFLIERVEVYRSHAPLSADQFGLGGAVFFEPRKPRDETRLAAMVGSAGARGASLSAGRRHERGGVIAGVELSAANNGYSFQSGNGTPFVNDDDGALQLDNADVENQSLWLLAEQELGEARIGLLYHHADRELGAPKLALTASRLARISLRRELFALTSRLPVEAWRGEIELMTSGVVSETEIDDPLSELGFAAKKTRTPATRLEQSVLARQALGRLRLVEQLLVSEERLRRLEASGGPANDRLNAQRLAARAALGFELQLLGPLEAEGTLAWTCIGTAVSGAPSCNQHTPNGRLGVHARFPGYELYASAGRYQRPPTLTELYGASLLLRGNPALQAELGTTLEAGARYQLIDRARRRVAWIDGAIFARFAEELVTYVRAAQGYLIPVNSQRSRTLGAELALGLSPLPFLDAEGSLSLLDPRDTSPNRMTTNDILPLSRLTASGLVSVHGDLDRPWLGALRLGLRAWHQASRYVDPAGLGVIPEQTSFDLEAAAKTLSGALSARLRLTNLFATRRFDSVGFVLPGRSVFLSLEATL
jgi:iron complex outermembrane receptor protein